MTITSNSAPFPFGLSITFLCPSHFCMVCLSLCKDSLNFIEYHLLFTESLISAHCRKTVSGKRYLWSQQGSPCTPWKQLTVIRHQKSELLIEGAPSVPKRELLFLLRVLFSPGKIKQRLFADNTTYLPGEIFFATSLQSVLNRRTFNPASQHRATDIPLLNTELLSVVLFSHSIHSSFIPLQHLRS